MELLIMEFFPLPYYLVPLRPKYSPQSPICLRKMINSLALHTDSFEEIGRTCCMLERQTSAVRNLEGIKAFGKQKPRPVTLSRLPKIISCVGK
jgi:hypothetical protein